MLKHEIATPALLLDLDLFQQNLTRMAARVRESGKALRPHAKAHKCVEIARRQIEAGACGVSVATVAEAELMKAAGIGGLLLTSPLADPLKLARAASIGVIAVADSVQLVEWWNDAAKVQLDVVVDLDVGDHRTGARSTEQAVEIAEAIDRAEHLRFRGIQAYAARGAHAGGFEERKKASETALRLVAEARDQMLAKGLNVEIVTGGSTGSWEIDTCIPVLTELQAGSYIFMDIDYRREGLDFGHALTVLTTVVSANHDGLVTVDGGFKAFATDRGYGPEAAHLPGSSYRWGGDEFGYLDLPAGTRPRLGDKIEFVPPHCDPTLNLYDRIYACRGEEVLDVWPVKSLKVAEA